MTRTETLEAAKRCVCGDREQDYGSPERNFETIAKMWNAYLEANISREIKPHDVAAMLGLLKIARIATGHAKDDNWVDLAGYAACGAEIEGGANAPSSWLPTCSDCELFGAGAIECTRCITGPDKIPSEFIMKGRRKCENTEH